MAGNPANASIWTDADVYVGDLDAQDLGSGFGVTEPVGDVCE